MLKQNRKSSVSDYMVTNPRKENRGSRGNNGLQQNMDLRIGKKYNELGISGIGDPQESKSEPHAIEDVEQARLWQFYKRMPQMEDYGMAASGGLAYFRDRATNQPSKRMGNMRQMTFRLQCQDHLHRK